MSRKRKPSAKVKKSADRAINTQTPRKNAQSKNQSSGSKKERKKHKEDNNVFTHVDKQPSIDPEAGLYGRVVGNKLNLLYYADPSFIGKNKDKKSFANCMMSLFAHKWDPDSNTIISKDILGMVSLNSAARGRGLNKKSCTETVLHQNSDLKNFKISSLQDKQQPLAFSIYSNLQPCGTCAGLYNQGVSGENKQHNYLQRWGIKDYLQKRTLSTSPVPWHHYCWMITTNEIDSSNEPNTSNEKRTWYATHIGNIKKGPIGNRKKSSQASSDNPVSSTCSNAVSPNHATQSTSYTTTSSHKSSPNDLLKNNNVGTINGKVKVTTVLKDIQGYVPLFYAHLKDHTGALDQLNNESVKAFLKKYADESAPAYVFSCDGSTPGGSVVYQMPLHTYNTRANKKSYPQFFSQDSTSSTNINLKSQSQEHPPKRMRPDSTSSTDINLISQPQECQASGQIAPLFSYEESHTSRKKAKARKKIAKQESRKSIDEQLREIKQSEQKAPTASNYLEAVKSPPQSSGTDTRTISSSSTQQSRSTTGYPPITPINSRDFPSLQSQGSNPDKTNNDKPPLTAKNNHNASYAKIVSPESIFKNTRSSTPPRSSDTSRQQQP